MELMHADAHTLRSRSPTGARLWEATPAYAPHSRAEICALFDSVYVSAYKGLGGLSGALLVGKASFTAQARVWLRRFGGNLYTLVSTHHDAVVC